MFVRRACIFLVALFFVNGVVKAAFDDNYVPEIEGCWAQENLDTDPYSREIVLPDPDADANAETSLSTDDGSRRRNAIKPIGIRQKTIESPMNILFVRIDFQDLNSADFLSDIVWAEMFENIKEYFEENTYNNLQFGDMTINYGVVHLAESSEHYTSINTAEAIQEEVKNLLQFDLAEYSRVVVGYRRPEIYTEKNLFYGRALGKWYIFNSNYPNCAECMTGLMIHELTHTLSIGHANAWIPESINKPIISNMESYKLCDFSDNKNTHKGCNKVRYDYFEPVGVVVPYDPIKHMQMFHKYVIKAVRKDIEVKFLDIDTDVSATFRLYAHNDKLSYGKTLAVVIPRPIKRSGKQEEKASLWIEYRRPMEGLQFMGLNQPSKEIQMRNVQYGAVIHLAFDQFHMTSSMLIDTQPEPIYTKENIASNLLNAPLCIGRTFSDRNVHITALSISKMSPPSIEIAVKVGNSKEEAPTLVSFCSSSRTPSVGAPVVFSVELSYNKGMELAYFWDLGDNSAFEPQNNYTYSYDSGYSTPGQYTVRLEVSNMFGEVFRYELNVTVVEQGGDQEGRYCEYNLLHEDSEVNIFQEGSGNSAFCHVVSKVVMILAIVVALFF